MDNPGTPPPSNSQIGQNHDALFPNRRVTQNVEDHKPSSRRINNQAENVADENNRAYEEAEHRRKGKTAVSASDHKPKRKGKPVVHTSPAGIVIKERENEKFATEDSASETDSEDDAEYSRLLNAAIQESLNTQNVEAPESSEAERRRGGEAAAHDIPLGAEYERQLNVAFQESLKSYYSNSAGRSLDSHALRTETGLARGVGSEVGRFEPDDNYWIPDPIVVPFFDAAYVAGQASEANAVGRQMVAPLLEIPEEIEIDYPSESLTDTKDDTAGAEFDYQTLWAE